MSDTELEYDEDGDKMPMIDEEALEVINDLYDTLEAFIEDDCDLGNVPNSGTIIVPDITRDDESTTANEAYDRAMEELE